MESLPVVVYQRVSYGAGRKPYDERIGRVAGTLEEVKTYLRSNGCKVWSVVEEDFPGYHYYKVIASKVRGK